jgi:hypothetical protein
MDSGARVKARSNHVAGLVVLFSQQSHVNKSEFFKPLWRSFSWDFIGRPVASTSCQVYESTSLPEIKYHAVEDVWPHLY